ncbi:lycopene beta-cyclase CrtY [Sphingomonas sp. PL-96]|uniref:lycopene beta-cyclase CrtY n=1 Tax=Sphingomonas sp. PL-96 TaxID=2887201 RepID=UPI001E363709|nr:lycopene beta-cyclase CrtY [Sphingomonas sp. PL-96]MCC2977229.1 lycopene beta-cyclase CrtY [Sphingomonas sp. PL-96]
MPTHHHCDLAILGGGLAGGLIALALAERRPELSIRLVDAGTRFGGNHLWSFFDSDVDPADRWIIAPVVGHRWHGYDVAFPGHRRTLDAIYHSVESAQLDAVLRASLPAEALLTGRRVLAASATAVVLDDGERIEARGVIDCRGPGDLSLLDCGWQKFLGQELVLEQPHGRDRPVVMDARVEQLDGYRFVYCLPLGPDRMFVEDTYYSDGPEIDVAILRERIRAYAEAQGWRIAEVAREEQGVLPVAMGGDFDEYWRSTPPGAKAGMRAGLFHPLTGYSLPDAVRTAAAIAAAPDCSADALAELTHGLARTTWRRRGFYRMLTAMLFRAAKPEARYRVLERFYRLDARLIGRFYAGRSIWADKARVLAGRPPVPVARAVRAIWNMRAGGREKRT